MTNLTLRAVLVLAGLSLAGCGGAGKPAPTAQKPTLTSSVQRIEVPSSISRQLLQRQPVARGLSNPRGMHVLSDGSLLLSVAGTGDPSAEASGQLLHLRDINGDGDYDDDGERRALLSERPSRNILDVVRRDEVFGMAGMAQGDGVVLASLAFFGGPSTIFRVQGESTEVWGSSHGNINDLAYDSVHRRWYGVASSSDEVVRLFEGGRSERVIKIPALPSGQDAVPGYLRQDPVTGAMLVSLFSGSPVGEEGGDGTELVARAGAIIAVDTERKRFDWLVTGLSVPTDFEIAPDGTLYVLEFCDAFMDPVKTREDLHRAPNHGGFKRFSGRLLRVDRRTHSVHVAASGLDAPTNLALGDDELFISEGMGTPGRMIPGPRGPQPLEGFVERIALQ